jgi:hypothetical protein
MVSRRVYALLWCLGLVCVTATRASAQARLAWDGDGRGVVDGYAVVLDGVRTDYGATAFNPNGSCGCTAPARDFQRPPYRHRRRVQRVRRSLVLRRLSWSPLPGLTARSARPTSTATTSRIRWCGGPPPARGSAPEVPMAPASTASGAPDSLPTNDVPVSGDYDGDGKTDIAVLAAVLRGSGISGAARMMRGKGCSGALDTLPTTTSRFLATTTAMAWTDIAVLASDRRHLVHPAQFRRLGGQQGLGRGVPSVQ